MKNSSLNRFFCLSLIASFLVFSGTVFANEKKILLKVPTSFSKSLPGLGTTIYYVADRVELISGGTLKMKVYEPGKLVGAFEILNAVHEGKVNAGYSSPVYWQGLLPAAPIFTAIPFGPAADEYLAWIYYGNGWKLWQKMYDQGGYNVHVIPVGIISPETSGWFAKEINSPDDLKGLRMRFSGLGGKVMQKLGVSVSTLPGGEIFPALEKGAIDATEFAMPAIDERLGFYKVVKYNYYPGWHQQATLYELLINKDTWNQMSKRQQMVLEVLSTASITDSLAYCEAIQGKVIRENETKRGVKNRYWSKEMLAAYKNAWDEVVAEQCQKDKFFKEVWEDFQRFHEDYAYWSSRGFLPREPPPR